MGYSHRDRRAQRAVRRAAAAFALLLVALLVVADLAPFAWTSALALLGLAAAGAAFLLHGDRLTREYAHDLAAARGSTNVSPALRVEVESDVGLDRAVVRPTSRSPHTRRPSAAPAHESPRDVEGR
ncbi:MAG: hypothetical protein ACREDK_03510 [Thermoplasmata archaeon]